MITTSRQFVAGFALCAVAYACLITSCGTARKPDLPRPVLPPAPASVAAPVAVEIPAKAGETDLERDLRVARNNVSKLSTDLATWQAITGQLVKDKDDQAKRDAIERKVRERAEFLNLVRVCLLWISGLAVLGGLACVVLAIVSPIATRTLVRIGIACGAVLIICAGMLWCLPWLPIVGVVVLASGFCLALCAGVWRFVLWFRDHSKASVILADGYTEAQEIAEKVANRDARNAASFNRGSQHVAGPKVFTEGGKILEAARKLRAKRIPAKSGQEFTLG